jgi:hypothetical protein
MAREIILRAGSKVKASPGSVERRVVAPFSRTSHVVVHVVILSIPVDEIALKMSGEASK